jgi:hypothetical protein
MVVVSFPEFASLANLGNNWSFEVFLSSFSRQQGFISLLFGVIKDGWSVLGPDVVALLVECRWIVKPPEPLQQIFVFDLVGVKRNLDNFGVACTSVANHPISRLVDMTTHEPWLNFDHAILLLQDCFNAPVAASAERGHFCLHLSLLRSEHRWLRRKQRSHVGGRYLIYVILIIKIIDACTQRIDLNCFWERLFVEHSIQSPSNNAVDRANDEKCVPLLPIVN